MSDPTSDPPDDPTDEGVSAHLDGEATGEEAARIESDPALASRLERFGELSARVADVPAAPPGTVDAHVAAAMAAFSADAGAGSSSEDEHDGAVVALPARDGSLWRRLPMGAVAAAAAVVVVAAGVVGLVASGGDGETTDTAATALERDGGSAAGSGSGEMQAGAAGARSEFASADSLATHLRSQFLPGGDTERADAAEEADSTPTGGTGGSTGDAPAEEPVYAPSADDAGGDDAGSIDRPDPCAAVGLLGLEPSSVLVVVPVVLEGRPVTAVVHGSSDDWRLVVVDDETCAVVVDRPL